MQRRPRTLLTSATLLQVIGHHLVDRQVIACAPPAPKRAAATADQHKQQQGRSRRSYYHAHGASWHVLRLCALDAILAQGSQPRTVPAPADKQTGWRLPGSSQSVSSQAQHRHRASRGSLIESCSRVRTFGTWQHSRECIYTIVFTPCYRTTLVCRSCAACLSIDAHYLTKGDLPEVFHTASDTPEDPRQAPVSCTAQPGSSWYCRRAQGGHSAALLGTPHAQRRPRWGAPPCRRPPVRAGACGRPQLTLMHYVWRSSLRPASWRRSAARASRPRSGRSWRASSWGATQLSGSTSVRRGLAAPRTLAGSASR